MSEITNLYEPCARVDGGINILKNGEKIWESPDPHLGYNWDNPAPNPTINSIEWQEALKFCDAITKYEKENGGTRQGTATHSPSR